MTEANATDRSSAARIESPALFSALPGDRRAALRAIAECCRSELVRRQAHCLAADAARSASPVRRVHYLSMEFLLGRALGNALAALGWDATLRAAAAAQGQDWSELLEGEADAALGNGGLGRLAACFLDSFAELGLPAFGYGLRYRYGMFAQSIQDGRQIERPDAWMREGVLWDTPRPELRYAVGFGGCVVKEGHGRRWIPAQQVIARGYDFIVPAHHSERVATLRLWQAEAAEPIDFAAFCRGDYPAAAAHQIAADALNWVLYPDDSNEAGRELRLKQEAFLVSASLQDLIARHLAGGGCLQQLGFNNAIHLNDTHPALAPAELMRLLLDEHGLSWDEAWAITRQATSYTNHTLMPEALETWPLRMFETWLPRHLEIIFEINQRFLDALRAQASTDVERIARLSLIDERGERRVRMAHLAVLASQRVNGVAELHSKLMVKSIFADFAAVFPQRFINITNGITPRRWLAQANPGLAALLDGELGPAWRRDLMQLQRLGERADEFDLGHRLQTIKHANKQRLADRIRRQLGLRVDPSSLFTVQVKRIHEYKRQLLNLLQVTARYQAILDQADGPDGGGWVPRTVILAGKAASAYHTAKLIVQLAHDLARVINSDPRIGDRLKLVFLPNYGVSLAEAIIPAADLSEQISTAGTEASGTGNMKFALNGACTLGTWDGANIEMAEAMGVDSVFVFGLRSEQIEQLQGLGYDPRHYADHSPRLRRVLESLARGDFSPEQPDRYRQLVDGLLTRDRYFLLADFDAYLKAQEQVDAEFRTPQRWASRALRSIAGMGRFSTDRTVQEYADAVWSTARAQTVAREIARERHA